AQTVGSRSDRRARRLGGSPRSWDRLDPRQVVVDLEPGGLLAGPDVQVRAAAGVLVEGAEADAQDGGLGGGAAVHRRAAAAAEGAHLAGRRFVLDHRLAAAGEAVRGGGDVSVGGERRAARPPALGAVAEGDRTD